MASGGSSFLGPRAGVTPSSTPRGASGGSPRSRTSSPAPPPPAAGVAPSSPGESPNMVVDSQEFEKDVLIAEDMQRRSNEFIGECARRRFASRVASPPTLVFDPVRDGQRGDNLKARVWIAPIDPAMDTDWLSQVEAPNVMGTLRPAVNTLCSAIAPRSNAISNAISKDSSNAVVSIMC